MIYSQVSVHPYVVDNPTREHCHCRGVDGPRIARLPCPAPFPAEGPGDGLEMCKCCGKAAVFCGYPNHPILDRDLKDKLILNTDLNIYTNPCIYILRSMFTLSLAIAGVTDSLYPTPRNQFPYPAEDRLPYPKRREGGKGGKSCRLTARLQGCYDKAQSCYCMI
jgi:hypothetical protein